MRFVTVASSNTFGFRVLKRSCDYFNIQLDVLGRGERYAGNGTKIDVMRKYLSLLSPDEIVLFTDGYDSFFIRETDNLVTQFKQFKHPILFSSEDNYYLREMSLHHLFYKLYCYLYYPKSESVYAGYKYLNSGGYMGYAGELLSLFEKSGIRKRMRSDQANLHIQKVQNPASIMLDYNHKIFTNYGRHATPDRFVMVNGQLTNCLTSSTPYVIHFPGTPHYGFKEFVKKFDFLASVS